MRTTIKDIAKHLGISANTVSKALTGKSQISESTRLLIQETAVRMNYTPNETARALVRKELRIAAVFPMEPGEFYYYIAGGIRKAALELKDSKCHILEFPYPSLETPEDLRKILRQIRKEKINALILTCSHQFNIYRNELERIGAAGIPIIYNTIFGAEDIPGLIGGVRMNTYVAGKMAAEFLGMVIPGKTRKKKIALFPGDKNMLVHRECIEGFYADAEKYNLEVVKMYETHEDHKVAYRQTGALMRLHPDLDGIYVTSYNALGVCDWFDKHPGYHDVAIIGHDLYPKLNEKLRSHSLTATLFQNQAEFGRESIMITCEYLTGIRRKEDCSRKFIPQLVLGCMVDNFSYYDDAALLLG
ncbi:MAG: LacI family transcriptional regulator [Treponema sp.]|jgi:DNA-binding LacI/PurR family transcriptional regulator|nr:LacI family transcriptional regulator [Treponema sp.]